MNVADAGGIVHPMSLEQVAQGMLPERKGYPMGKYRPLNPKNSKKDLVLGQEVPISALKVEKVYDVVPSTDLSTEHKEIYQKYTGTVKSVDTTDDGQTSVVVELSPKFVTRAPGVTEVTFRENEALFFKKPGVQYGGRRTKKQKRSRRRRTLRYR